jgi:UDP-3-O-[3-hydroxymyristoyl] N-acetylglucosamine deacetylase
MAKERRSREEPVREADSGANASQTLRGVGLHSGKPCSVTLTRSDGPVVICGPEGATPVRELVVRRADHGVQIATADGSLVVDSVEHLFAALGGLGIYRGVAIQVEGGEIPLLDGGALALARSLRALGLREAKEAPARLFVARAEEIRVGGSTYSFAPSESTSVAVVVDFDAPRVGIQMATWDGDGDAFVRDVAPARTFGFRRDGAALAAAGRARGVDPKAVMVLADDGSVERPSAAARPGEFARHKLLDLVGDSYLFGGPAQGTLHATRPGHAATHRAFAQALDSGVLGRG